MCGKNERGYIPKVVATAGRKGHAAGETSCFTRPLGAAPNKLLSSLAGGHPWSHLREELSLARLHPSQREEWRPGAGSQDIGKFASAHNSMTSHLCLVSPWSFPAHHRQWATNRGLSLWGKRREVCF